MKYFIKRSIVPLILLLFLILLPSCAVPQQREIESNAEVIEEVPIQETPTAVKETNIEFKPPAEPVAEVVKPPEPKGKIRVNVSAVGDIMMHMRQIDSAKQSDGSFDFKPVFEHIKPYIESADIALGNIETTINTPGKGFYGFPRFRSPREVVEALKDTGFDVITTSNNHILDNFTFGLELTLNTLEEFSLQHTGAARTPKEREEILIIDKNGIKIAILAYTYGTNGMEAAIDAENLEYMVVFLHETERIINDVKRARESGADMVIACLHWGNEYQRNQDRNQEKLAEKLIGAGVDIIFGSHPHVLQPIVKKTVINEAGDERQGLVVYSMGNFVSNQRNQFRDSGMIVNVEIIKDLDLEKTFIGEVSYVPTWVHRYNAENRTHFRILPVGYSLDTGLYKEIHGRLAEVWEETTGHVGDFRVVR